MVGRAGMSRSGDAGTGDGRARLAWPVIARRVWAGDAVHGMAGMSG